MAVDQPNTIDFVSTDPTNRTVLTISDHLDWTDSLAHQLVLQSKFNAYLRFVESGELLEKFPKSLGRPIVFSVVLKYPPDQAGFVFLDKARGVIESAGFLFAFKVGI
jgi:hypothetical protein